MLQFLLLSRLILGWSFQSRPYFRHFRKTIYWKTTHFPLAVYTLSRTQAAGRGHCHPLYPTCGSLLVFLSLILALSGVRLRKGIIFSKNNKKRLFSDRDDCSAMATSAQRIRRSLIRRGLGLQN
jgi:hypothetical protein